MEDQELNGVRSLWEDTDVISLFDFGQVFVTTNGGGTKALAMKYDEYADDNINDYIDYACFVGQGSAKMGEDVFNSKPFALTYPAARFGDKPCSSTSAQMDFRAQDGTLFTIGKLYQYAWGSATGICKNEMVKLYENQSDCSSNLYWHSHAYGSETIVLDNKMCVVRFSMICGKPAGAAQDTVWTTLQDYLKSHHLEIASIDVSNLNQREPGIAAAELNLQTGLVTPTVGADTFLTILPNDTLREIKQENATPDSYAPDAKKVAWGSTFYVAIPCPLNLKLDIRPLITVRTQSNEDHHTAGPTYFGSVSSKQVKEGDYYMTAPIIMVDDRVRMAEDAKIYLYYHSSYVWDTPIDIY